MLFISYTSQKQQTIMGNVSIFVQKSHENKICDEANLNSA